MNKAEYQEYLTSGRWEKLREERLAIDHHRCVFCGAKENLRVHHINYLYLGKDNEIEWLATVCDKCHGKWHKEILPDIQSAIEQLNSFYERKMKELATDYTQARDKAIIERAKGMTSSSGCADKCRAARIMSFPGYKASAVKFVLPTPYDAVLKSIGGKGKPDDSGMCFVKFQ